MVVKVLQNPFINNIGNGMGSYYPMLEGHFQLMVGFYEDIEGENKRKQIVLHKEDASGDGNGNGYGGGAMNSINNTDSPAINILDLLMSI